MLGMRRRIPYSFKKVVVVLPHHSNESRFVLNIKVMMCSLIWYAILISSRLWHQVSSFSKKSPVNEDIRALFAIYETRALI